MSTPIRSRSSIGATPSRNGFRPPSRLNSSRGSISSGSVVTSPTRSRPNSSFNLSRPTTPFKEPYTGTITVSIRPNPVNIDNNSNWLISNNTILNTQDQNIQFQFDNIFKTQGGSNFSVYQSCCSPIVDQFLNQGFNGTVFAYGMTGSGKTYSIKGVTEDPGFIELTINDIFRFIENNQGSYKYGLNFSYLEIYNEKINDLLNLNNVDLKIRDDLSGDKKIVSLTTTPIQSRSQCLELIRKGEINRKTSSTDFNARSSRSHSILQIKLTKIDILNNLETKSTLSLCDLAGSERASSSLERRKEGSYINKSLLALSNVINKLSTNSIDHIPYRDSKLTRLLQPALSGSSLISILCTIQLNSQYQSETINTLRFAARAKDIVMSVEKNTSSQLTNNVIQDLNNIIEQQRNEIERLKSQQGKSTTTPTSVDSAEVKILYEKLDHLTRLTDLQKTETILIKNDVLNDILGSEIDKSQIVMHNIEDFYKRISYEQQEYKSYIEILESKLRNQENKSNNDFAMDILKEQEEEIINLKEQLRDKDQIIKSLSNTTKLRKLVESNNNQNHATPDFKRPIINIVTGKENDISNLKEFQISPKPPKSNFNVIEMDMETF
ncbi:unnamed protein product [Candida verbasci]|uniref:Kinesin-like protein n=1 Tax=Candida verbasci TaxID=1227364 RepID=A0A9W4XAT3_9ASCO|nr:unnamed protein product [Candida verbasci]